MTHPAPPSRFDSGPLGRRKAAKFALVEGMSLDERWAGEISRLKDAGLSGDALRAALTDAFASKRG